MNPIRYGSVLTILLVLASGAGGSATGIQNDAESGGDAPDDCIADQPSELALLADGTYGQLVTVEDPRDVYTFVVRDGEPIQIVQDLASSDDLNLALHAPATPSRVPDVREALVHEAENPFALQVRDRYCQHVADSSDPHVLPRVLTIDTPGTYQAIVYEADHTGHVADADVGNQAAQWMCHPPCNYDGYVVDLLPA